MAVRCLAVGSGVAERFLGANPLTRSGPFLLVPFWCQFGLWWHSLALGDLDLSKRRKPRICLAFEAPLKVAHTGFEPVLPP